MTLFSDCCLLNVCILGRPGTTFLETRRIKPFFFASSSLPSLASGAARGGVGVEFALEEPKRSFRKKLVVPGDVEGFPEYPWAISGPREGCRPEGKGPFRRRRLTKLQGTVTFSVESWMVKLAKSWVVLSFVQYSPMRSPRAGTG